MPQLLAAALLCGSTPLPSVLCISLVPPTPPHAPTPNTHPDPSPFCRRLTDTHAIKEKRARERQTGRENERGGGCIVSATSQKFIKADMCVTVCECVCVVPLMYLKTPCVFQYVIQFSVP